MKTKRSPGRASSDLRRTVDQDGVVRVDLRQGGRERWIWIGGLAALAAVLGLSFGVWRWLGAAPGPAGPRARSHAQAPELTARSPKGARTAPPGEVAVLRPLPAFADPDPEDELAAGDGPEEGEPEEVPPAGQARVGIGLFPAPGTKPIKRGIVVPDDFELPPGYMRHFQATDHGRMLEAILVFHPDYKPVDASGNPIPMPPGRVVPPELAPPGMPIKQLEVPHEEDEPLPDEATAGEGEVDNGGDGADSDP